MINCSFVAYSKASKCIKTYQQMDSLMFIENFWPSQLIFNYFIPMFQIKGPPGKAIKSYGKSREVLTLLLLMK